MGKCIVWSHRTEIVESQELALWLGMIGENDIQIAQQDALQR
jgi:hypothetical protein